MDSRYEHHQMTALWSQHATLLRWLAIEQQTARVQARHGLIPIEAAEQIGALTPLDPAEVAGAESRTHHDVGAFLVVADLSLPPEGARWLHYGLTSSDLVDTGNAICMEAAADILCAEARGVIAQLEHRLAGHTAGLQRWARTHGQHAEPISLVTQFHRLSDRMRRAHDLMTDQVIPGTLSGPTGQCLVNNRRIEAEVLSFFGVEPALDAGQIVPRDHYASWAYAVVGLSGAVERIATEVRLSAQTGIEELAESFGDGQVGSTAMPHKRNPIRAERLCGLARVARGYLTPILETADALWGERDISNSSVERVALRDLAILVAWMLHECSELLDGLVVLVPAGREFPVPSSLALAQAVQEGERRSTAHSRIASQSSPVVS